MATEQELALALNPYDPSYLKNLPMGQSQPSLLGNTTKLTSYGLPETPDGGGGGMGGGSGISSGPISPTTPEEFAAQSARNQQLNGFLTGLTKMSPTGLLMSGLNTMFGKQSPAPVSDLGTSLQAAYDLDAANNAQIGQSEQDAVNAAMNAQSMQSMQDAQAADTAAAQGSNTGGISNAASSAADGYGAAGSDTGGFGGGTDSGSDGWAKGGRVNKNQLTGPDPQGPDDGYGALQGGEFVVKKAAVRKYGEGMLGKINAGKYTPRS